MAEQQNYVLTLSGDEVVLLEEILQDYKDRLRHEAQMELDLTGNTEGAHHYNEQASVITDLRHKVTHAKYAELIAESHPADPSRIVCSHDYMLTSNYVSMQSCEVWPTRPEKSA